MARRGLTQLWEEGYRNTKKRLAFREFGTALGMRCGSDRDDWERRAGQLTTTWEKAGLVLIPEKGNAAGVNAEDDLLSITETMYAAGLISGGEFNDLPIYSVWLYYIDQLLLHVLVSII